MGATIGTRLSTWLKGKHIGTDDFGNRYYTERRATDNGQTKRWVIYNGMAEPSKVPPMWHAWLHYTIDQLPSEMDLPRYEWLKPHIPNLTGTKGAYMPPGHLQRGAARDASASDYVAWKPNQKSS